MRTLLLTIICALQSYCLCNDTPFEDTRIMARAYPIQKKIPKHRNIQILNAQKFIRSRPLENHKFNSKKQILSKAKESYTVFPSIPMKIKKLSSFPESPYFPIESLFDQKPNKIIKKMLPEDGLWHLSRRKRSANLAHITNNYYKTTKSSLAIERHDDSSDGTKNVLKSKLNESNKLTRKQNFKSTVKNKGPRGPRVSGNKKNGKPKVANSTKIRSALRQRDVKNNHETRNNLTKQLQQRKSRSRKSKSIKSRPKKGRNNKNAKKVKRSGGQVRKVLTGRRLIAGKDALIEEYPYVVSIQKNHEHWCAGALLNPRLVITTANCVWKSDRVSRLLVRAGSRHTDRGGQVAGVQEMMRHPAWSLRRNPDHDVALLLLDMNIKFSHGMHSVDLPNRALLPAFEDAWVTSWGSDRRDGIFEKRGLTLQSYHARLMNHEKCNNITQRFGILVSNNFICLSQIGKRAPCTRDTGAPAVSDGVLWGLASWGIRKLCGTERYPAMFSYLASHSNMDFITNATHLLMADERFYPYPDRLRDFPLSAMKSNVTTLPGY